MYYLNSAFWENLVPFVWRGRISLLMRYLARAYALSVTSKCFKSCCGILTTALRWSKFFKAHAVSDWWAIITLPFPICWSISKSPFLVSFHNTHYDMFNLLCELSVTRNILLTVQGTARAVNWGACLLHVALISASDTPRNLGKYTWIMGLKKFSQDKQARWGVGLLWHIQSLGFTPGISWPIPLLSARHQ